MRPKPADDMVQSAIRLPRTLHERLKKAGGDRGMGEEVRRRLEASFAAERSPTDAKTRELLDAIAFCAEEMSRDFGPWSEEPYAFAVLKETIRHPDDALLSRRVSRFQSSTRQQVLAFLFGPRPSASQRK